VNPTQHRVAPLAGEENARFRFVVLKRLTIVPLF
jgi:hypothetical protein